LAIGGFKNRFQTVGQRLVGAEDSKVVFGLVQLCDVTQKPSQDVGVSGAILSRGGDAERVVAEIGHPQIAKQSAPIGVWIRSHMPAADRGEFRELGAEAAKLIEKFRGPIAFQPTLEQRQVLWCLYGY
jgi:hypothetical protein